MNQDKLGKITFAILGYNRTKESILCVATIVEHCKLDDYQVLYVSNGGDQEYVDPLYRGGLVDTVVMNKANLGCGIGTKLAIQTSMTEYVAYIQCDQFMVRDFTQSDLDKLISHLVDNPNVFYIDLAGNQGGGKYSERAGLVNRKRYLDIPGIDSIIGGPGPYANNMWTEEYVQRYIADNHLSITSLEPLLFGNNGKWSIRDYPCGGQTKHSTDEKRLFIIKPLKRRYDDFPNLKLSDHEWTEVLESRWPTEGKIPEADKAHSFIYWP